MRLLLFIVFFFVRNQMRLVAMDTIQLHNQHILWPFSKKKIKYPTYLDAKQVVSSVAFFCILYVALKTGGSLSFSGSYSGTKRVFSSQYSVHEVYSSSKKCNTGILIVWLLSPHCLMLKQNIAVNVFCVLYYRGQATEVFCPMWIILIYSFTYLLVYCRLDLFSLSLIHSDSLIRCQECQPVLPGCGSTG